jgi:hypothetical protein
MMANRYEGAIVTPNYTFEREQAQFPQYRYPTMGKLLTVLKAVRDDYNNILLWFSDFQISIPLAAVCFNVLQYEEEGDEILNEAYKIVNQLP